MIQPVYKYLFALAAAAVIAVLILVGAVIAVNVMTQRQQVVNFQLETV